MEPTASSIVNFQPISLEQLVDSPMIAGRYFREVALAPEVSPRHYLDIVADHPEDLEVPQARIDELSQAIRQAGLLFRSHHYDDYRFLNHAFEQHLASGDRSPAVPGQSSFGQFFP